jgi:hypothetical protein
LQVVVAVVYVWVEAEQEAEFDLFLTSQLLQVVLYQYQ